jgi:hypothetical protein
LPSSRLCCYCSSCWCGVEVVLPPKSDNYLETSNRPRPLVAASCCASTHLLASLLHRACVPPLRSLSHTCVVVVCSSASTVNTPNHLISPSFTTVLDSTHNQHTRSHRQPELIRVHYCCANQAAHQNRILQIVTWFAWDSLIGCGRIASE